MKYFLRKLGKFLNLNTISKVWYIHLEETSYGVHVTDVTDNIKL